MSSLQMGLAIAGGVVLAAVVAHGAWTSRRNAPRQAQPGAPAPAADTLDATEPELDPVVAFTMPPAARKSALDPLVDALATVTFDAPEHGVFGQAAIAASPPTRRVGSKPFAIEGLHADSGQWESLQGGQRYRAFQAGVQLANRSGALNEIEFSEFVQKTQAFADALGGNAEFPDMADEVARARELDQFASVHDAQLQFSIRARQAAWSPGFVLQHAARLGLVPGALPGRMVLPAASEGLPPVLVLEFDTQAALAEELEQSALREVRLHLDVPQVDAQEQPFERMCQVAQSLAQSMDGVVTDDHGRALAQPTLDGIARDLQALVQALAQREFTAGSALARRLFS
ncbi:MAG: cell division protein ZipA C-terminal FtsZ-binding domain-containing protein [Rhodoferax sp.]